MFMRKDLYQEEEMEKTIHFLTPLFENGGVIFKKMLDDGNAYLEGKSFTFVKNIKDNLLYKIMGNCIGPVIYVRDILPLEK